jgi:uncharacterized protein (TIGR04551 family)
VEPKYPHVAWHGYYRFRADLITEADLGTFDSVGGSDFVATSLFLPSLSRNAPNKSGGAAFPKVSKEKEKTIGTANMRLRLVPVFHLADTMRIGTTIDILDNLILGSTPDYLTYSSPYVALDTFTGTQVPPVSGINSFQDSFTVKEAWAEWDLAFVEGADPDSAGLGTVKMGRYAYGWGLGIHSSTGDYMRFNRALTTRDRFRALDADWGNYLDRIQWSRRFGPLQVMLGYGWLSSGTYAGNLANQVWAPYDLSAQDNIRQVEFALFDRPDTERRFRTYRARLFSGKPVFTGGLHVAWRFQDESSHGGTVDPQSTSGSAVLLARNAWQLTPDLHLSMDYRPSPEKRFYVGLEAVASFGRVGDVAPVTEAASSLDVMQFGWALESTITLNQFSFGLDAGMASGDDGEIIGAYAGANSLWGNDGRFSAFSFNKNYHVDQLLFREVLGSVSNAVYFRPHFSFDLLPGEQVALGGGVNALYAMAVSPDAYPGNSRNLGLEFGANVFYEETDRFLVDVGFGTLFPFAALDRPENFLEKAFPSKGAVWAWTLQSSVVFVF